MLCSRLKLESVGDGTMIFAAAVVFATLAVATLVSVEDTYRRLGLLGNWAADCDLPATPANPHVTIVSPSSGLITEAHDAGPDFAINRYSVLSAKRLSATRLSVAVIFNPGAPGEERQKLTLQVGKNIRRTLFNRVDGGERRVKNGVALSDGTRTPLLRKCE
jgi:hypothetical protein